MRYCDFLILFSELNYYRFELWQYISSLINYLSNLFSCVSSNHDEKIANLQWDVETRTYVYDSLIDNILSDLQMAQETQFLINYDVLIVIENLLICFSELKVPRSENKAIWISGRDFWRKEIIVTTWLDNPSALQFPEIHKW